MTGVPFDDLVEVTGTVVVEVSASWGIPITGQMRQKQQK